MSCDDGSSEKMVIETHQLVGLLVEFDQNWCNKFSTNYFFTNTTTLPNNAFYFALKALGKFFPGLAESLHCWSLIFVFCMIPVILVLVA